MSEMTDLREYSPTECPDSILERRLIEEYLLNKGYRWSDLRTMPEEERKTLLT